MQGFLRFSYDWFVLNNSSFLCKSMPKLGKYERMGKISYYMQIHTRSYPFLRNIFDIFYVKKLKKLSKNNTQVISVPSMN